MESEVAIEEPKLVEKDPLHGERWEHPAFGHIGASRVSGQANLHGSDFTHSHYITITIEEAQLCRSLSRDWNFTRGRLIEVALSEAQWATFVSSLNHGGTPCTLAWTEKDGRRAALPPPKSRRDQFQSDIAEDADEAIAALKEALQAVEDANLPKGKAATLRGKIESALMKFTSSMPFVANSFEKHMETVIESSKVEVNAYVNSTIARAGLEALSKPLLTPPED